MIDDLQPYPAYRDSGVEWLGAVPAHWEVRRLKHTFRRIVGGSTPSSTERSYWGGEIVWVTPVDVNRAEWLGTSLRKITREGLNACSTELVPPGSIVVTCRAPVGNVAIASVELCTNQGCKALVPNEAVIEPRYGLAVLGILQSELQSLATGTTFTEITTAKLGVVSMPLPPLPEQSAIVRFLDYADRRIRRYIRAKQRLIALLNEQKQAIIHRAVTRGLDPNVRLKPSGVEWLGDVPEHWEVQRLKRLVTEAVAGPYGSSLTKAMYTRQGYRVYGQQQVIPDDFNVGDYYISPEKFTEMARYRVFPQDVLLSVMGTVGRVAVVPETAEPGIINPRLVRYRPNFNRIRARYMQLAIQSPPSQAQLAEGAKGTTMDGLNMQILGKLLLPVPPLHEQDAILTRIALDTHHLVSAISGAQREIELLREYRTRLIADVVTGKLDVRAAAALLPDETGEPEPFADEAPPEGDEDEPDLDAIPKEAEV